MPKKPFQSTSALHIDLLNNSSGAAMVFVLVVAVIGSIVMASIFFTSRLTIKKSGMRREKIGALNIAEAGKEEYYAKLLHDKTYSLQPNSSVLVFDNEAFGKGSYSVRSITSASIDSVLIQASGREGPNCVMLEIQVALVPSLPLNFLGNIGGAVTSRYDVNLNGSITIDGRDHDSLGNPVGNGLYGVHTCTSMNLKNGQVGGGGVAPVGKKDIGSVRSTVCREMAPISSAYASPEAFLGVASGSLDQYKTTTLPSHFEGIYYLENNTGPVHFDNCRGILIVHNSSSNAELKINSNGTFKGLIICDVMNKINGTADVYGAVVTLGNTTSSTFGNGSAKILYSAQVLNNLINYCKNVKKGLSELSWKESECP